MGCSRGDACDCLEQELRTGLSSSRCEWRWGAHEGMLAIAWNKNFEQAFHQADANGDGVLTRGCLRLLGPRTSNRPFIKQMRMAMGCSRGDACDCLDQELRTGLSSSRCEWRWGAHEG